MIERYSRQQLFTPIGSKGQEKVRNKGSGANNM